MREAAIDFLIGVCIGLAILFSFGAMMLVFDTFFPREQHAYRAASEPPKPTIGRMSYGAGASDTKSRATPVTYRSWDLPIMKLDQQLRGQFDPQEHKNERLLYRDGAGLSRAAPVPKAGT